MFRFSNNEMSKITLRSRDSSHLFWFSVLSDLRNVLTTPLLNKFVMIFKVSELLGILNNLKLQRNLTKKVDFPIFQNSISSIDYFIPSFPLSKRLECLEF